MKPLVSVIIPNYNYERYLREAIDSALAQTYPNIEIIVVDDGSTDSSREIIESYGSEIRAVFQKNQGVSAARNNGAATSKGEYIAFLDADDVWLPEKLQSQIHTFASSEEFGLVHVGVEEIDAQGNVLRRETDGLQGSISRDLLLFERAAILGGGSGIMTRRRIFDEIGGFDTDLSTSADWDISYRISSRHKVGFVKETLLRYRMHGSNMHGNIELMEREMLAAYGKAFASADQKTIAIKNTAYGNLHKVLAGSYFRAGSYSDFFRNVIKSLKFSPRNLGYFVKFPLRIIKRRSSSEKR